MLLLQSQQRKQCWDGVMSLNHCHWNNLGGLSFWYCRKLRTGNINIFVCPPQCRVRLAPSPCSAHHNKNPLTAADWICDLSHKWPEERNPKQLQGVVPLIQLCWINRRQKCPSSFYNYEDYFSFILLTTCGRGLGSLVMTVIVGSLWEIPLDPAAKSRSWGWADRVLIRRPLTNIHWFVSIVPSVNSVSQW